MKLTSRFYLSILFSFAFSAFSSFPGDFAQASDRLITVTGTCHRIITPDRASVILTAEDQNKDLKIASQKASETYARVRTAVQKLGLEAVELKTVEYSLNAVREWVKDREVMKGYKARIGLSVSTSQTQRLGEVLAIAAREEIRDIGKLSAYLSDDRLQSEQFACLKSAAENARAKADRLAASLNVHVGETVSVNEGVPPPPNPPTPMMSETMNFKSSMREMAPPSIEAGQQPLSLTVLVTFSLR